MCCKCNNNKNINNKLHNYTLYNNYDNNSFLHMVDDGKGEYTL